jgi:hypothetical protein
MGRDFLMATLKTILHVLLLVLLAVPTSVGQARKSVKAIEIRSGWGGLGTPQKNVVTIERKGDEFISNGRSVITDKVQALVSALLAEPVTKPELMNLGITTAWLKTNVASQNQELGHKQLRRRLSNSRCSTRHSPMLR